MIDVKKAIIEGEKLKEEARLTLEKKNQEQQERDRKQFFESVEFYKKNFESTNELSTRITKAVAAGESSFMLDGGEAMCQAIRELGLNVRYTSGYDNINSDEVKEFWEHIEVTWS